MDIEQLKLILETLQAAGDGAFTFGIWWIVAGLVPDVLLFVFGITGFFVLSKIVVAIMRSVNMSYEIAHLLEYSIDHYWGWTSRDSKEVLNSIRRLQKQAKSKSE